MNHRAGRPHGRPARPTPWPRGEARACKARHGSSSLPGVSPALATQTRADHVEASYGGQVKRIRVAAPTLVALGGIVLATVANDDGRATTGIGFPASHGLAHGAVPLA